MEIIRARDVRTSYGGREILHGVDFDVAQGTILGILGPNGSGKTTLVEILGGLRPRDGGTVEIEGTDPRTSPPAWRSRVGMQLQQCRLPARLRVAEAVDLFGSFYEEPVPTAELLAAFDLDECAQCPVEKTSGGQQQRLSVALALVGRPRSWPRCSW